MILTDFKIAVRNILYNKVQSTISILGLAIGLGSMILLMALIVHEKSFERYIPVAVLTISWQSWRAATRNPVEALRYE